ncbi:MAG TPA: hypothetical protein VHZ74_14855 [Bryobacteraceae bacterium]|jgi:hypothetical protein|nr:hypothetical protein [Bryobacteraceae bacterium]
MDTIQRPACRCGVLSARGIGSGPGAFSIAGSRRSGPAIIEALRIPELVTLAADYIGDCKVRKLAASSIRSYFQYLMFDYTNHVWPNIPH